MTEVLSPDVAEFLDAFDRRNAQGDTDTTALFGATFLALDPTSVVALTPRALAAVLPARKQMFAGAGVRSLCRENAREQRIDEQHTLIRVEWVAERDAGPPLRLSSSFLLRREPDGLRVVVYLNHDDVRALLASA